MADLTFPWQMFLDAQRMKNDNQKDMWGNIAGMGQGLGQGLGSIGDIIKQHHMNQLIKQYAQGQTGSPTPTQDQMPTPDPSTMQSAFPTQSLANPTNPFASGGQSMMKPTKMAQIGGKNYVNINGQWFEQ